jgi:hypothetical protein
MTVTRIDLSLGGKIPTTGSGNLRDTLGNQKGAAGGQKEQKPPQGSTGDVGKGRGPGSKQTEE